MKRKALLIILSSTFTLSLVFAYTTTYSRTAKSTLEQEYSQTNPGKRRCEKCKRGADGKMECVEVPCPK
jgi:hypothetical protein